MKRGTYDNNFFLFFFLLIQIRGATKRDKLIYLCGWMGELIFFFFCLKWRIEVKPDILWVEN
jgi:hypothetical protein